MSAARFPAHRRASVGPASCGRHRRRGRGIALLDALAAFGLLSLALLGVLRWQAGAHVDARLARDRTAAATLVAAALERLRDFTVVDAEPGRRAWADLVSGARAVTDQGTPFEAVTRIADDPLWRTKLATVEVAWTDLRGEARRVSAPSVVDAELPVHRAVLMVPARPGPVARPHGRAPHLPAEARDAGDGRHVWRPGAGDGTPGTGGPAYVLDSLTGDLLARCPPDTPTADLATCPAFRGLWLSGHVRFSTADPPDPRRAHEPVQPFRVVLRTPPGAPAADCRVTVPLEAPGDDRHARYTCVVPMPPGQPGWSGRLDLLPDGWTLGTDRRHRRVCRYAADVDGDGRIARPEEHPADYAGVTTSLAQQNFLVVRGDLPCPRDGDGPHNGTSADTEPHRP